MYRARLFASRHARAYEVIYNATSPVILSILSVINKLTKGKLDRPITWFERLSRGFFLIVKCVVIVYSLPQAWLAQ